MNKIAAYATAFFNHENYHGWFKKKRYFEGWYFKIVDKTEQHALALIPGIAMDAAGYKQAFIQVLDGKKVSAEYHKFDAIHFQPDAKSFKVSIKENFFSAGRIKVDLPSIHGSLHLNEHFYWPKKLTSPGIMGWYSFVPFMECYHQVVSMNAILTGKLTINQQEVDFTGGKGYIEKDWGRSFPSSWVWMQSNHFEEVPVSFKLSVARIPWLTGAFVGFICAFLIKDQFIRFATYTGAKLKSIKLAEHSVTVVLEDKNHILHVTAHKAEGAELASPVLGFMDGRVKESMNALIDVELVAKRDGAIIFKGTGRNAGLEIAGNTDELQDH